MMRKQIFALKEPTGSVPCRCYLMGLSLTFPNQDAVGLAIRSTVRATSSRDCLGFSAQGVPLVGNAESSANVSGASSSDDVSEAGSPSASESFA